MKAINFSHLPKQTDPDAWKIKLNEFGYVSFFLMLPSHENGYAIFENEASARKCVDQLNMTTFPENSDNVINVAFCEIEEINSYVALRNKNYNGIDFSKPETGPKNLFRMTKTQPPVFWSLNK